MGIGDGGGGSNEERGWRGAGGERMCHFPWRARTRAARTRAALGAALTAAGRHTQPMPQAACRPSRRLPAVGKADRPPAGWRAHLHRRQRAAGLRRRRTRSEAAARPQPYPPAATASDRCS